MVNQYTDSYSSASADIQNIVANDISLLENYILLQTGQNEWTALISSVGTNKTRKIRIYRINQSGYNNQYQVERTDNQTFEANIENEYYVYSNVGYGKSLNLPVYEGATSWAVMIINNILSVLVLIINNLLCREFT